MTNDPPDTNGVTDPKTFTYAYDVHGSTSLLLNEGGGARASYGYDAYGEQDDQMSGGDPNQDEPFNPYRYSARRYDSGSNSIDMGARRFGPDTMHFLQQDQYMGALSNLSLTTDPLTQNRYSLAGGNPVSFVEVDWSLSAGQRLRHRLQLRQGRWWRLRRRRFGRR